ncbi:MAG: cupin domain-containing protein [Ginsengibacter sp.]
MKKLLIIPGFLITTNLMAQTDSLHSGVYNWSNLKPQKTEKRETRKVLEGSALDLANLEIHTSTIGPGVVNHPPYAYNNLEELILIKEGSLQVTINDTTKVLGPGSIVFIVAGDTQSFKNISETPVTYYVLSFRGRNPVNIARGRHGGGSFVKDWKDITITKTQKGESRQIFDRPSSMFERFDMHATNLEAGMISHPPHTHRAEEIILMIKGNVQMQIGENFYNSAAGDVIFLEANVPHALKNTGSEQCSYFAIQWHN